ncbi:MAG: PKD domain-containing protein [Desulfuromonadaceae bacterium]
MKTIIIWTAAFVTLAALAFAGVPQTINYQGYLKNTNGTPVGIATTVRFSLYSSVTPRNNPVWRETKDVSPVNGIYSTQLGSVTPITASFDVPYYLGVKVASDLEMALQPLSSSPYALRAGVATTVASSSIGTAAIADGSIITAKIANGAVTDAKIAGPISAAKIPDLAGLQASVATLQATVSSQQTALTQLQTTTSRQQTVIDALQIQISHLNSPPSVSGGYDLTTAPGTMVMLYGTVSDPDAYQTLTWSWSITGKPVGSSALLSSTSDTLTLFTPDLAGVYQFNLTASDGVTTVTGSATLTVTAGITGRAQLLETDNTGSANRPQVAMDGKGNAMAVWYQTDGFHNNIWANRYTPATGWGAAQLIETDNAGEAYYPQVAMDSSGNAIAVWYQFDGIRSNIWANRYTPTAGWGTAQLIETDNGSAGSPQIAMTSGGTAMVVWYQYDTARANIWANRYTPITGWGTAQLIESDNPGDAVEPQVAIDPVGNAVAVWYQSDGSRNNIWANRYSQSTGLWGTAQLIETDNTGTAYNPQVVMDPGGNAVAVWVQSDGTRFNIYANQCSSAGAWGTAQLIENNNTGRAFYPHVAMDSSGTAMAVWQQYDTTRDNIWANRYTPGGGWGTPQLIETDNNGSAENPRIAMSSSGTAVVSWQQLDGTRYNNWANSYTSGGGWGTAQLIEADNTGNALIPQVAIDNSGYAFVVWQQSDGTRDNIRANLISIGWRPVQLIENNNAGDANYPQVAMDSSGTAMAVWRQYDGSYISIWANRYTPAAGWSTPQLIETDNSGHAFNPKVAMDSGGNAIAVWQQSDGTRENIWANRYTPAGGWGTAQLIETDNAGTATYPQIAMNSSGTAVAVWKQSDGTRDNIWANRYTTVGGWGTAQLIESDNGSADAPRVAIDSGGVAVAVWMQSDGSRNHLWSNRSTTAGVWGTAQLIETDATNGSYYPHVAMNAGGTAIAIWQQPEGSTFNVWVNHCSSAGVWGGAKLIETNTGDAFYPQVAIDAGGNAVAVWQQYDGTRYNIWANQYSLFSNWGVAQLIETDALGNANSPQLAMNSSGTAVVVWHQSDGTRINSYTDRNNIWTNSFTPGVGWGSAMLIDNDNTGSADYPQVAIGTSGEPLVVWQQSDGARTNIWANRRW